MKKIGKYLKLKYLRERCGYSQVNMGLKIGVSPGQYSKKENGTQPWGLDECIIIRNIINDKLKSLKEDQLTIDEIFFIDKVAKTTQKKGA